MSLLDKVLDGEVPLHSLEERVDEEEAIRVRRKALEEWTGASLEALGRHTLDVGMATEKNIENMIGATQVPVGVAGPLEVNGEYTSGDYYVPLATTEGALVASVNRGCNVITEAGGAVTRIFKNAMTRAPVFRVDGVRHAKEVVEWVREHGGKLEEAAEGTTDHGELLWVDPYVAGDNVYLRFGFDTKDAMGMNMVTVASRAAAEVVEERTGASLVALSGNVCTDKKPAAINLVEGRGKSVCADVVLPRDGVEERLKTTPEAVAEVNSRKTLVGSARAGILGANAHAANVLAAVYLATGQDGAQVVEGSCAITTMSVREGDLYAGVTLPAIEVGTVGGGTALTTQKEALELMGLEGGGDPPGSNSAALAELVAGAVLAGELSLHAALASDHLDEAHVRLGR